MQPRTYVTRFAVISDFITCCDNKCLVCLFLHFLERVLFRIMTASMIPEHLVWLFIKGTYSL